MSYDDWKLATPLDDIGNYCQSCSEPINFHNESNIETLCIECYELLNLKEND